MLQALPSTRPPFLILAPICVLLGVSVVSHPTETPILLIMVFSGGLLAHISVNALNEYQDFRSGLDLQTEKTPFSGGSGLLVARPELAKQVLIIAIASLLILIAIGIYLIWLRGWLLLVMGLTGVLIILTYTRWLNKNPWLCLIAPGFAFGTLMVLGTEFTLTGQISSQGKLVSLVPFFLSNNLLLLNQIPDIDADKAAGRHHAAITFSINTVANVFLIFLVLTAFVIVGGVWFLQLPNIALAALLFLVPAGFSWQGIKVLRKNIAKQPKYLAMNVFTAILTPLILAGTLMV